MFLISALCLNAQEGTITGIITDSEDNQEPLLFAKVTVKETGDKAMTDASGAFAFEHLKEGTYTLICSFMGYDTKEIKVKVNKGIREPLNVALTASTVSLDDLAMVFASSEKKEITN